MSRIGKRTLLIPEGVQVSMADRILTAKGPKGELKLEVPFGVVVKLDGANLTTVPADESKAKFMSPYLGLANSLILNTMAGVKEGFSKKLELSGVGYRAKKTDKGLSMTLGFSHPVEYELPKGVDAVVEDNTKITVSGIDKQLVGLVCAKLRKLRKPEPYKGKGIKYADEVVRRKPGKAGKAQK